VPISLLLADNHPLVLRGLESLFRSDTNFRILALCKDDTEVLQSARRELPDILIADLRLHNKGGLGLARELIGEGLQTRIILLAEAITEQEVVEAIRAGVKGIVLKELPTQLLVKCVEKVWGGEQWIESRSTSRVLEKMVRRETAREAMRRILTSREIEIVDMVGEGLHNKEIAERLFISEGTVKVHLHRIFEKLKVDSRMGLAHYAFDNGLPRPSA